MSTEPSQDDELNTILWKYRAEISDIGRRYVGRPKSAEDQAMLEVIQAQATALQALKVREEGIAVRARISELERLKNDTAHQYGWGQTIAVDYKIIEDRIAALTQLQGEATEGK